MTERVVDPVRIAALGDLHIRTSVPGHLRDDLMTLNGQVDAVMIAGDITESGRIPEVEAASRVLSSVRAPMFGVLGNHDRRGLRRTAMRRGLEAAGLVLLDGDAVVHELPDGRRLGIAGVSGTGGGFLLGTGDEEPLIGNRIRQAVAVRARREAERLRRALAMLAGQQPDVTVVVTHFSPTLSTLGDEPPLKYWMLGNSLLGEIIDEASVDLVVHGHAHIGNIAGETPGGTPVRNVAMPVAGGIVMLDVGPEQAVLTLESIGSSGEGTASETTRLRMSDLFKTR